MKFAAAYFTTNIARKLGYWFRPRCFHRSCPSITAATLFWPPSSNRDSLPARWSASKAASAMLTGRELARADLRSLVRRGRVRRRGQRLRERATGLVGLPGHLPRIRRVGVPDNLQYRHRREHRARLSRRPVRPDKSRPEQLRIAARIRVLSWRRRRRRALLVLLRLLRRQFVEVLENQIDVGGDLNRDYSFESGVQFG